MTRIATTRLSSKGQVIIPQQIREALGLEPGAQFVVVGEKDAVILKRIVPPNLDEFDALIGRARSQARRAGVRRSDVRKAVERVRRAR